MRARELLLLFRDAFLGWNERKAPLYAAALAYSTLFSLAPLLIISVYFASLTLPRSMVEARILQTIQNQVGSEVADLTREILSASYSLEPSGFATLLSFGFLLFGASSVFMQLRGALNAMWGIDLRNSTVQETLLGTARSYILSILVALGTGLLPILLLFASTIVASVPNEVLFRIFGAEWLGLMVQVLSSPVVYFVVFALIFKFMAHAHVPWRAVWPGAMLTAFLYWIGSAILSLYVQNSAMRSFYGAAGSAIALLLWAYYSAWILLYGAKFVQVFSVWRNFPIVPNQDAAFVETVIKSGE